MDYSENAILKEMTRQADEMFFIYSLKEKRFVYANAAFEIITKRAYKQLLNDPFSLYEIVHKDDREYVKESFDRMLRKKANSLLDFRILRKDNVERWIRLKVYPIIDEGKITFLSGIVEDDSARKASIFNMQKINGWKDSILHILSHDLRGPIGIVKMLSSAIASKQTEKENKEVHEFMTIIQDICKRNLELIDSLLSRESLNTAEVEVSRERVDLVWEIKQVLDIYIKSQQKIGKLFELTHSHDYIFAEIDSMKFLQIINNLVSNAIKFTGEHGKIKIHIEKLEKSVTIQVADNGIGIPKNLQPVLFNKFTTAGRKGVDGEKSVGLGMWIVKSLTEAHGGRVWFESTEGKGSTFYVEIPQLASMRRS